MLPSEPFQTTMNKKDTLEMLAMLENSIELVLKDIKNIKKSLSPKVIKKVSFCPRYFHSESVKYFLENCCESTLDKRLWPITSELYSAYLSFCEREGIEETVSINSFLQAMKEFNPAITKWSTSKNGQSVRKYTNITLK